MDGRELAESLRGLREIKGWTCGHPPAEANGEVLHAFPLVEVVGPATSLCFFQPALTVLLSMLLG